jgi:hypothetical protein
MSVTNTPYKMIFLAIFAFSLQMMRVVVGAPSPSIQPADQYTVFEAATQHKGILFIKRSGMGEDKDSVKTFWRYAEESVAHELPRRAIFMYYEDKQMSISNIIPTASGSTETEYVRDAMLIHASDSTNAVVAQTTEWVESGPDWRVHTLIQFKSSNEDEKERYLCVAGSWTDMRLEPRVYIVTKNVANGIYEQDILPLYEAEMKYSRGGSSQINVWDQANLSILSFCQPAFRVTNRDPPTLIISGEKKQILRIVYGDDANNESLSKEFDCLSPEDRRGEYPFPILTNV